MLFVVTGAPAAGKSTWVRATAKPGDLRFDTDAMINLLSGKQPGKHHHDSKTKTVATAARQAGIDAALPVATERDVYIIHSNLDKNLEAKYRAHGARFVVIDPGVEENLRRCAKERPGYKQKLVRAWYARRNEWPRDAVIVTDFDPAPADQPPTEAEDAAGFGDMSNVHVVIGPPAAGKSTFVRENAGPADVVIDFDLLANALSNQSSDNHDHTTTVKQVTRAARAAAIGKACGLGVATWMIHSSPAASTLERYRAAGATVHVVDPGKDVVMSRCKRERPPAMLVAAAKWYEQQAPSPVRKTTTERGLGWEHQRIRERLLAVHRDGAPCWWCGGPMYRDKARNFDGQALAADHELARAHGGDAAGRLLHGSCNSSRGDGTRDAQRPAAAPDGSTPTPVAVGPPAAPPGPAPALSPAADYEPAAVYDWPAL